MNNLKSSYENSSAENHIYREVYRILVIGMWTSNLFFLLAAVAALLHAAQINLAPDAMLQEYSLRSLYLQALRFDPLPYAFAGVFVLVMTPIARVVISIAAFLHDRDYRYVVITSIVLACIVLTLALTMAGVLR